MEPLIKLMSGDWLPRFGPFPGWNFAPWNHHAAHSSPKMDSKWDCHSSTQSFARGSMDPLPVRPRLQTINGAAENRGQRGKSGTVYLFPHRILGK